MPHIGLHPGAPTGTFYPDVGAPGAPYSSGDAIQYHRQDSGEYGPDGSGPQVLHVPLAKCRVLYIGSAVPLETAEGLEAVQAPLRERYNSDTGNVPGIDAWLTIFSSGLQLQFVEDKSNVTWFPIQTLHVCAAVKQVTGKDGCRFVALDSAEGQKCTHPPLFACIMRRTKGRKVLECHAFVCKSNEAAMACVQASVHAYEHKEGWTDQEPDAPDCNDDQVRLLPAEPRTDAGKGCGKEAPPEFYQRVPEQGYFYTSSGDIVRNYNVYGEGPPRQAPAPQPLPPPPPPPPQPPHQLVPVQMGPSHPQAMPPPGMMAPPMPMPDPRGGPIFIPQEYFSDWGMYSSPVVMFPPTPPDDYRRPSRRHRSPGRHHRRHHRSPPRMVKEVPAEYRPSRRHEIAEVEDPYRGFRDYYPGPGLREDPYRHDLPDRGDVWYDGRGHYSSPVYKGLGYMP